MGTLGSERLLMRAGIAEPHFRLHHARAALASARVWRSAARDDLARVRYHSLLQVRVQIQTQAQVDVCGGRADGHSRKGLCSFRVGALVVMVSAEKERELEIRGKIRGRLGRQRPARRGGDERRNRSRQECAPPRQRFLPALWSETRCRRAWMDPNLVGPGREQIRERQMKKARAGQ